MANPEKICSPEEIHCVFVETSLDTRLALPVHKDEIISDFKEKLRIEHKQVFPEIGEINVSALKIKRRNKFYHFSDSMSVWKAFDGISRDWFIYVDAVRVEVLTIMSGDRNGSNVGLVEKKKEIDVDSVLVDAIEEGLETKVVEKKTRKRSIRSSDGKTSRKKSKVDVNQSAVATTELSGKVEGEVASQFCVVSPRERVDDVLTGAIGKETESGEKNGIIMAENQQTTDVDMLSEGRILTVNPELVDGLSKGEVKGVPDNQIVKEALEKVDDLTGAIEQDLEKGGKAADIVMITQEKDLQLASELVDGEITSRVDERGEGSRLAPSAADNLQTTENQLEGSSSLTTGPATEKKRKRAKSSKHHISQSTAERETLGNTLVEAEQKETEMGEKSVKDGGRDNIETDNLASHPENHLEVISGLTTTPVTEKKKRRKKILNDHINEPPATVTATAASREIVNEINLAPENVDRVDATSESYTVSRRGNLGKENEMGEKMDENVESGDAIPSSADKIQTDNLVSYPENQVSSDLRTGPATDKIQDASVARTPTALVYESKTLDDTGKFMNANTSHEPEVSKEKVEIDADQAKSVKSTKKKSSRKAKTPAKEATLVDSQNVEPIVAVVREEPENVIRNVLDSLQQNNEAEENLGKRGKKSSKSSKKKNSLSIVAEAEVVDSLQQKNEAEENLETNGKKSRKSSKKKNSLSIVTEAEVVDSLQQKNEAEENMEKSGKKSSKRSKKKDSLKTVKEAQVLSVEVNNVVLEEASPINNPKDSDASFTLAKKDTENDASHLKKSVEVADNTEDNNFSKQIQKENADMGNNFGSSQKDSMVGDGNKQDQVRTKSKNEETPSGSVDGSVKPKERKVRVQPASSVTSSQLHSKAKNDRSVSEVDRSDASVKGAVNKKKEAVKKSSNTAKSKMNVNNKEEAVKKSSNWVTLDKSKTNFFKDAEMWNSDEDESKTTSLVSTRTPSLSSLDNSSGDDSDVTSMSRKQGNNMAGGTNKSLQDILRSSQSYKKAKLTASQSQPDELDDDLLALDFVPDSVPN